MAEHTGQASKEDLSVWQKFADNFALRVLELDHVRSPLDHMQETRYLQARQHLLPRTSTMK